MPLLSAGYIHKLSERWRLGLGLATIAGAVLDPDDDWAGRQQITETSLLTLSGLRVVSCT